MTLDQIAKFTPIATYGMTVAQFFDFCVEYDIPGMPFADEHGDIIGRLSLRHIVKQNFIPEHASNVAHLMGDERKPGLMKDEHVDRCLCLPVDKFVLTDIAIVRSYSPIFQALARMEKYNSSYLFVVDDRQYQGIITRSDVVKELMSESNARKKAANESNSIKTS